jgi:hypothetical protein
MPAARREVRLAQLAQMLRVAVTLDDGQAVDVAASVVAVTCDIVGTRDLSALQRAADAASTRQELRPPGRELVVASCMSVVTLPEGDWIRGITIRQPWATCIPRPDQPFIISRQNGDL